MTHHNQHLTRKIITLIVVLLLLHTTTVFCLAAETAPGKKETIIIGRLDVLAPVLAMAKQQGRELELELIANSLSTQFFSSLNAAGIFQLVERSRKGDIELEQGFATVAVDPNDKNMARAGKMAGAKFIFLPQIDGFEEASEIVEHKVIGRRSLNRKVFLSATVRIVDTTTGKIFPDSPSAQLTKEEVIDKGEAGQISGSNPVIVALAREMAQKLSQEIIGSIYPAKVLSITGKQIMLNRGTESGFNSGDIVEIYAYQNVEDPDTKEVFRNEIPVGKAIISRVLQKQSYAAISEDFGIVSGCIVRRIKNDNPVKREENYITPGSSERPMKWE